LDFLDTLILSFLDSLKKEVFFYGMKGFRNFGLGFFGLLGKSFLSKYLGE
jgi:hypothetical protein